MILSRNITIKLNWILDNLLQPIIRDNHWFMDKALHFAEGRNYKLLMNFKDKFPFMADTELIDAYTQMKDLNTAQRPTDCNSECVEFILRQVNNFRISSEKELVSVLEAGAGRGYISRLIAQQDGVRVTACDLVFQNIDVDGQIEFVETDLSKLPFADKQFDIVVCTHTLEHIRDYHSAISELRRVCCHKLIVIIPKQREYRYTPDLHVNFCPYLYRFKMFMGIVDADYLEIGGHFVCVSNSG
ncbi:MAG: class I SAM-dependent methyltransferase [Desulfovibrio sp.]|nr:class I SAM-dependent methyltransferase [Desulfovibrio sp.]